MSQHDDPHAERRLCRPAPTPGDNAEWPRPDCSAARDNFVLPGAATEAETAAPPAVQG
jgi:hypothetical protein